MADKTLTYNNLIDFSIALDAHILNSECFFDDAFLNLIEKHLGYSFCTFICYESNSIYKESHGHNIPMGEQYENSRLPDDPLASYISKNFDELYSRDINIVRASEVLADYKSSEFRIFLQTYLDLSYVAVILFDNLRLSIYKSESEGDFTKEEVEILSKMQKLINSKYALFSKVVAPAYVHTLEELKNKFFDTISTGVVILNERFEELDCNNVARKYVAMLSPSLTPASYFANLLPLLNLSSNDSDASYTERVVKMDDYIINIKLYSAYNHKSYNTNTLYFITIVNNTDSEKSSEKALDASQLNEAFGKKYNLSPRETEIVEALSYGQKYQDIADSLFISINTVRTHVKNIYRKLEIDNQRNLLYLYNQFIQNEK